MLPRRIDPTLIDRPILTSQTGSLTNTALMVLMIDAQRLLIARGAWSGSPLPEAEVVDAEGAFRATVESTGRLLDRENTLWRQHYG